MNQETRLTIDFEPAPREKVKETSMGNITRRTYVQRINDKATIKKTDKDHYVVLATGEVKAFRHQTKRLDDRVALSQSFGKLRDMIRANFEPGDSLFITFTYRRQAGKPMTDLRRLYADWKVYLLRFARRCKRNGWERPRWVVAVEPQRSGAWHIHGLFFWAKGKRPFYDKKDCEADWGQGFVKPMKGDSVDDLGRYLSAYLSDVLGDDEEEEEDGLSRSLTPSQLHHREKCGRLKFYPAKMRVWRCSRDCRRPTEAVKTFEQSKKDLGAATLRSKSVIRVPLGVNQLAAEPDFPKPPSCQTVVNWEYITECEKVSLPVSTFVKDTTPDGWFDSGGNLTQRGLDEWSNERTFEPGGESREKAGGSDAEKG